MWKAEHLKQAQTQERTVRWGSIFADPSREPEEYRRIYALCQATVGVESPWSPDFKLTRQDLLLLKDALDNAYDVVLEILDNVEEALDEIDHPEWDDA